MRHEQGKPPEYAQMAAIASGMGYWWESNMNNGVILWRFAGSSNNKNYIGDYKTSIDALKAVAEWHGIDFKG